MNQARSPQWLVKTVSGKELGPLSTHQVLEMIRHQQLKGDEKVRRYPDGKWKKLSQEKDFYDQLLEVLKLPAEVKDDSWQFQDEKTIIVQEKPKTADAYISSKRAQEPPQEPDTKIKAIHQELPISVPPPRFEAPKAKEKTNRRELAKAWPLLVGAILVISVASYYLISARPQKAQESSIELVFPKTEAREDLSSSDVKKLFQESIALFTRDTIDGYLEAQNRLVRISESQNGHVESRGVLCLVYRELWNHTVQTSAIQEALVRFAQGTKSLDPVGINGAYCEIIRFLVQGQSQQALGVIENALNERAFSTAPVLYQLKAEMVEQAGDPKTSSLYAEKAHQLWPDWVRPLMHVAEIQTQLNNAPAALQTYQKILALYPDNKKVQVKVGSLLYRNFQQKEEALIKLSTALSLKGRIDSKTETQGYVDLASLYYESRDIGSAKMWAEKALKLNPKNAEVSSLWEKLGGQPTTQESNSSQQLVLIGDQYARAGNHLAAQAEYKTAFELDSKNANAAFKAARSLWMINQGQEAISWLERSLKSDPKLAAAYALLADYQSARHEFTNAAQTLAQGSRQVPNNQEILRTFALVEYRRNNFKDAIAFLEKANKIFPNDIETLVLLSRTHLAQRNLVEAQQYAVKAIEIDASHVDAQIAYSKALMVAKGLATAELYIKDLIKRFSYTVEYRYSLGEMYLENERIKEAQKVYEQILVTNPRDKKAHFGLGLCFQMQNIPDRALKSYLQASIIDPSDAEPLYQAAQVFIEINQYDKAIQQLDKALKIAPLFPRLNYLKGKAQFLMNDLDNAIKSSQEEKRLNPSLADPFILSAEIYTQTRQFQKCSEEYQQAIKLRPKGAELYWKAARCYRLSGNLEVAESMLNVASGLESGLPEIYREQGSIFEARGERAAAVQAYTKYLALAPNAPDRLEVESRLSQLGGRR